MNPNETDLATLINTESDDDPIVRSLITSSRYYDIDEFGTLTTNFAKHYSSIYNTNCRSLLKKTN